MLLTSLYLTVVAFQTQLLSQMQTFLTAVFPCPIKPRRERGTGYESSARSQETPPPSLSWLQSAIQNPPALFATKTLERRKT